MPKLDYPDRHHLSAAIGWLELGAIDEANRELSRISAANLRHAEVLDFRWHLQAEAKDWEAALEIARQHTKASPKSATPWIHQSFALHELKRTKEAFLTLLPQADRFPKVGTIPYNLACYCCRLGRLEQSRQWLKRAIKVQGRKTTMATAATDPDLAEIRDDLKSW